MNNEKHDEDRRDPLDEGWDDHERERRIQARACLDRMCGALDCVTCRGHAARRLIAEEDEEDETTYGQTMELLPM